MKTLKTYLLIALAMLATLTGCGPGTGGTGTGPSVGSNPLPLSTPLTFSTSNSINLEKSAIVIGPTYPVVRSAILSLENGRVELRYGCKSFVYSGSWSIDETTGNSILIGTFTDLKLSVGGQPALAPIVATLYLSFSKLKIESDSVSLLVKDNAENTLIGPFQLSKDGTSENTAATTVCNAGSTNNL